MAFGKPDEVFTLNSAVESDSDDDSDDDSVFSSVSSVSDFDEPNLCSNPPFNPAVPPRPFYCIPDADPWSKPLACSSFVPSIQCF